MKIDVSPNDAMQLISLDNGWSEDAIDCLSPPKFSARIYM